MYTFHAHTWRIRRNKYNIFEIAIKDIKVHFQCETSHFLNQICKQVESEFVTTKVSSHYSTWNGNTRALGFQFIESLTPSLLFDVNYYYIIALELKKNSS